MIIYSSLFVLFYVYTNGLWQRINAYLCHTQTITLVIYSYCSSGAVVIVVVDEDDDDLLHHYAGWISFDRSIVLISSGILLRANLISASFIEVTSSLGISSLVSTI